MKVLILIFAGAPRVPLLNFEGGSEVHLLDFTGVLGPTFNFTGGFWVPRSQLLGSWYHFYTMPIVENNTGVTKVMNILTCKIKNLKQKVSASFL